jgi:hypothetical protein
MHCDVAESEIKPGRMYAREDKAMNNKIWSRLLLSTALAGGLALAVGTPAQAGRGYRDDCERKLEADRGRIDHDAARFGEHSRQVSHDVAKMDETRRWCQEHKADWDHARFDVGLYFNSR